MTGLEIFLTVIAVVAVLALIVVGILLRKCFLELRIVRDHLRLINEDEDGQLEVLDRMDRVLRSRIPEFRDIDTKADHPRRRYTDQLEGP